MKKVALPERQVLHFYDYHEMGQYLLKKYKVDLEDLNGTFYAKPSKKPFKCFWHFLVDRKHVYSGCYFYLREDDKEDAEDWQIKIIDLILSEFGEKDPDNGNQLVVNFYVSW